MNYGAVESALPTAKSIDQWMMPTSTCGAGPSGCS